MDSDNKDDILSKFLDCRVSVTLVVGIENVTVNGILRKAYKCDDYRLDGQYLILDDKIVEDFKHHREFSRFPFCGIIDLKFEYEYSRIKKRERHEEIRIEQLINVDYELDTFKFELLGKSDIDDIYIDQAPQYSRIYDRTISSVYTPLGIRNIDSFYIKEIQDENRKTDPVTLAKMIRHCPNIHNVIKTNLLDNLKSYSGYDGINMEWVKEG